MKVVHVYASGHVIKEPMADLDEARADLAAIVRQYRRLRGFGFEVVRLGLHRYWCGYPKNASGQIVTIEQI